MNDTLIQTLLLHLARLGVREVCIAAGARNAPLISALAASSGLRLWHFFEERSAAFFALGRMMIDTRPVAVVTTSGTAAAELLPAVIEAHYQAQPLVMITADRPARFRGTGAPQAIEQVGLFGAYAERTLDVSALSDDIAWPQRLGVKPLHINVCLDEPLAPCLQGIDFAAWDRTPEVMAKSDSSAMAELLETFVAERSQLIVLAAGLHPREAASLAPVLRQLGAPIVAEATANLHGLGLDHLLAKGGERALRQLNPKRVLRLGSVPSWRWWRDLEHRDGVHLVHLARAPFPGLARHQSMAVQPLSLFSSLRLEPSRQRGDALACEPLETLIEAQPLSEPAWMRHLSAIIPSEARVFIGNSLPIREWNLAAVHAHPTFANRGANGIDGLVSTFYGVSVDAAEAWLILGDLSAMYDLSAPWIAEQLPVGRRRIVVINNGGGKIFSRVASLSALDERTRSLIENRHQRGFEAWAQMWSLSYVRAQTPQDLQSLPEGDALIEVVPDGEQTEAFWAAWSA